MPTISSFLPRSLLKTAAVVVGLNLLTLSAGAVERLPVETFFKNPERAGMTLSGNGRYLAALAPMNGRMNLFVVDTKEVSGHWLTGFTDDSVSSYYWANDERLLFTLEGAGKPELRTALFSVNLDGSDLKDIVPALDTRSHVYRYTQILDLLPENPDEILVVSNKRLSEYPDVYRMRVNRRGLKMVMRNPGDITGWITDRNGDVRLGLAVSKDGKTTSIRIREKKGKDWKTIGTFSQGEPSWTPLMFAADNDQLIVASDIGRDFAGVYRYDWRTEKMVETIWESDSLSFSGLVYSGKRDRVVGIAREGDKPGVDWLDPEFAALQKDLDLAFPGEQVFLAPADRDGYGPSDRDETRFLVRSGSSQSSTNYHLLDAKTFQMQQVAKTRPWIDPKQMAEMKPIRFKARDGREIQGYLTLPVGGEKNLPLVLHPHGGPWARDSYRFNPEVQYFANRGFAVLQINYRGSTGFGREHLMASRKQFGEAMQDDLIDGVNWAIAEGIADPKRLGVYGASYGGYATMVAITKTPDMFQWGINYVGVVDIIEQINWYKKIERDNAYYHWTYMAGDPEIPEEADQLWNASPMNFLDRIKVPLFIIHGTEDANVSINQSLDLMKALDGKGIPYRKNIKKEEGHGYQKEENKLELYQQFDEFLAPFMPR